MGVPENPSGCLFQIWPNNQVALGIVFEQSSSTAQKSLSEVARHVGAAVSPRISLFGHVVGHSGQLWNELADTLYDHKSRGVLPLVSYWDQLVLKHRPPLRLDSTTLRWAPVLLNFSQPEGYTLVCLVQWYCAVFAAHLRVGPSTLSFSKVRSVPHRFAKDEARLVFRVGHLLALLRFIPLP